MSDHRPSRPRRHDRRPSDAQRDERVKVDGDPDDVLRKLLGVKPSGKGKKGS